MRGWVTCEGVGIAGIACSDGRTVTVTDDDGSFELTPAGPHVFVTVPTGYATSQWYMPAGADEATFVLTRQSQAVPFTFAHVGDMHLSLGDWVFGQPPVTTPEVAAALFDEIATDHPEIAFVAVTGDQTNDGTDGEFAAMVKVIDGAPVRIVDIPGNHDHNSADPAAAATETPWDRFRGPRWFSFDYGGVHFVAIDWTSYHLGVDREVQDAWVAADLSCVQRDTPVIFLTHDLMPDAFFASIDAHVVASFSGHWHTSRVVRSNGALHVNTGNPTFGGLDYSPAHYRVARWDGERVTASTVVRGSFATARPATAASWSVQLRGEVLRAGPVVDRGLVLAASSEETLPAGFVEAFDIRSGAKLYEIALDAAIKSAPRVCGSRAVATAVTGETVCFDPTTGSELWRTKIDEPLRLWTYLRPATDGQLVFVGDTARFVALDLADGSVRWQRDDLGVRGNITCHASPVVVDGRLVVAFAAQVPDLWVLDAATGDTIRPADVAGTSVYNLDAGDLMRHLSVDPTSGFAADPDGEDVYVIRLGNRLDRIHLDDGEIVWSAPMGGWFNPAPPVIDGDDVFACDNTGTLRCIDRADGALRWATAVTEDSPLRAGPYRASGGVLFGEPAVTADHAVVACGDGRLVTVGRQDGRVVRAVDVGAPVAAPPALAEGCFFVADITGRLIALPAD